MNTGLSLVALYHIHSFQITDEWMSPLLVGGDVGWCVNGERGKTENSPNVNQQGSIKAWEISKLQLEEGHILQDWKRKRQAYGGLGSFTHITKRLRANCKTKPENTKQGRAFSTDASLWQHPENALETYTPDGWLRLLTGEARRRS